MARIFALLLVVILAGQFAPLSLGVSDTGMDVKDEPPNDLWWMSGQPLDEDLPAGLKLVLEKLASLIFIEKRADMRAVYGSCFWNPNNSTLFIVLTDTHVETLAIYERALSPPPSVHIVYRNGPATYVELEGYVNVLREKLYALPLDVVEVNSLGITENATILIGIPDVTPAAVEAVAGVVHGIVPEELVFVRRMDEQMTRGELQTLAVVPANTGPVSASSLKHTNPGPIAADTADNMLKLTDYLVTFIAIFIPLSILMLAKHRLSR